MSNSANHQFLRISAGLVGLTGVVQAVMGAMTAFGMHGVKGTHGIVGMVTFVITLVAVFAAWRWSKESNDKGLFMHAASVAVLALVQIALGELKLESIHIALGVAYTVAAIALATLAFRKPAA